MARRRMIIRSSGGANGFSSGGHQPGVFLAESAPPAHLLQRSVRSILASQPAGDDGDLPTSSVQPFDFYISTTGSDANPGTLAAPWAITSLQAGNANNPKMASKRVGLLPGTYDVSALIPPSSSNVALNINGGSSAAVTYIGSSDASGNYSRGTATIDAKGASGFFGGSNSNAGFVMGNNGIGVTVGFWTIDGLVFTGFSIYCICIGNAQGGLARQPSVTVQNCTFTGGSAQSSTVANGVNLSQVSLFTGLNVLLHNNYHHDNLGWTDNQHFSAVYIWGQGTTGSTYGTVVQFCTFVNTGNINGKNVHINSTTIQNCYIDMTLKTPSGGQEGCGVISFSEGDDATVTSIFRNNIIVGGNGGMDLTNTEPPAGWFGPFQCYNTTWVMNASSTGGNLGFRFWEQVAGSRLATFYNNLVYRGGATGIEYGYVSANTDGFALCDYNYYSSGLGNPMFTTVPPGQQASAPGLVSYSSLAAWSAAIGGLEAHSLTDATNPLNLNTGTFAKQYQVAAGSSCFQAGRIGGVPTGAVCNLGAWDGIVTKIGCDFAT